MLWPWPLTLWPWMFVIYRLSHDETVINLSDISNSLFRLSYGDLHIENSGTFAILDLPGSGVSLFRGFRGSITHLPAKFLQNATICDWVVDDWTNFLHPPGTNLSKLGVLNTNFCTYHTSRCEISHSKFRQIMYSSEAFIRLSICCFASIVERFKHDWGQKSRPKFHIFDPTPVKFRGG